MGITAKDEVGWGLLQRMKWVGITAKDEVGRGLLQRMKWGGDYCKG